MAAKEEELPNSPPGKLPSSEDIHILLVDDERLSRIVVANLLRKCNYRGACRVCVCVVHHAGVGVWQGAAHTTARSSPARRTHIHEHQLLLHV